MYVNILSFLSTNGRSDRYNPCYENLKCACSQLSMTVSFLRQKQNKKHHPRPHRKTSFQELKKGELVGYRETESRDHLLEELIT